MKIRRYRTFIRRFNTEGAKRRIPRKAMYELTYRCNFKCVHCYAKLKSEERELVTKEVYSILDQMRDMGVFHVTFTGGEIFTRPDILDILDYARRIGFEVSLLTNGSLITEDIADWLIERRIRDLEISFLGANRKTFEEITQESGSYEKVLNAIKMFRDKGVITMMKTCILDLNLDEADKIMELAKSLGVSFRYSQFVVPRLDCERTPTRHRISPEEFIDIRKRFVEVFNRINPAKKKRFKQIQGAKEEGRPEEPGMLQDGRLFRCMAGRSTMFINPYGQMKPCIVLPVPNYDILKGGVRNGWEYMKRFVDETKVTPDWGCKTCELNEFCGVCPARSYLNTGDMLGCPEYFKEVARLRKERYEAKMEKVPQHNLNVIQ